MLSTSPHADLERYSPVPTGCKRGVPATRVDELPKRWAPWRDLPERFGNWNTIYKNFNRWSDAGVWARVLERVQSLAQQSGDIDWVTSIDSTIVRVHQHGATLPRVTGGSAELQEVRVGAT